MLAYTLRRLASAVPTVFCVVLVAFLLVRSAPGGPFDSERVLPPAIEANIDAYYQLDAPLTTQFFTYLGGVLTGDLGPSYRYRDKSVNELIAEALPYSILLGALAMAFALVIGVAAGVTAALLANSRKDRWIMGIAMAGISIPVFVLAPMLVLVFAVKLQWLPAGWSSEPSASKLILPVIALALPQIAYIARLTRASLIDVMHSDYIRTARAQGLRTATIIRHHALKPALLPVVSYLGPAVAMILAGSVVVEEVFGIPGLGQFFVRGALNRDYTLVLGVVIFYATLIIALNLLVDLVYGWLDPRIRRA